MKPAHEWRLGADGEAQAKRLAAPLRPFLPFRLVSSTEPKAARTCEIVARELGLPLTTAYDLRELDRRVLPILSAADHERLNAQVFTQPDQRVIGVESAREALDRFSAAVQREMRRAREGSLVVVTHGTVISLLVAQHNQVDAFDLWKRLSCPSLVLLESPSLALFSVVPELPQSSA